MKPGGSASAGLKAFRPRFQRKGVLGVSDGTAIEPFNFNNNPVRVVMIDGEPWFVAADVARVLGYRDAANAVRILRDKETGTHLMSTRGGLQELKVITEQGLYRLVMRSDKAEAEAFQDWVTGEVLPAIRRTGAYVASSEPLDRLDMLQVMIDQMRADRDRLNTHDQAIRELQTATGAQQLQIDQLEERHERVTAVGYANTRGLRADVVYLNRLGRIASTVAKAWGIPTSRVHSTVWGEVNAWPAEVWDEALDRLGR